MDQEACFGKYLRYTALSVLGTLGVSCYILADTFFVSKGLGTKGLAALNLAIPVYNFIHGTGLMLGMGGATKFSVRKKPRKVPGRKPNLYKYPLSCSILCSRLYSDGFFLFQTIVPAFGR